MITAASAAASAKQINNNNTSSSGIPKLLSKGAGAAAAAANVASTGLNANTSAINEGLRQEILQLKTQLRHVTSEKHRYEQTFRSIQERMRSDIQSSLYLQAQGYEARLTELHSIIGELKRRVEQVEGGRILEEDEDADDDDEEEEEGDDEEERSETNKSAAAADDDVDDDVDGRDSEEEEERHQEKPVPANHNPGRNQRTFKNNDDDGVLIDSKSGTRKAAAALSVTRTTSMATSAINNNAINKQQQKDVRELPKGKILRTVRTPTTTTTTTATHVVGPSTADLLQFQSEIQKIRQEHIAIKKNLLEKESELESSRRTIQILHAEKVYMQGKINELEESTTLRVRPNPNNNDEDELLLHQAKEPRTACRQATKVQLKTNGIKTSTSTSASPSPSPAPAPPPLTAPHQSPSITKRPQIPIILTGQQINSITSTLNSSNNETNKKLSNSCTTLPARILSDTINIDAKLAELNCSSKNNRMIDANDETTVNTKSNANLVNNNKNSSSRQEVEEEQKEKQQEKEAQLLLEIERLHYALENSFAQNEILQLNLEEGKDVTESLTLILGKYESRFVTMEHLLQFSSQLIESYDVLVALLESELGQLLANCRAVGIGSSDSCCSSGIGSSTSPIESDELLEVATLLQRANENRAVAESAAGSLLGRILGVEEPPSSGNNNGLAVDDGEIGVDLFENPLSSPEEEVKSDSMSCGGWGDTISSTKSTRGGDSSSHYSTSQLSLINSASSTTPPHHHSTSTGTTTFVTSSELNKQTESRIRSLIIQLKTRQESLRSTLPPTPPNWNMEPFLDNRDAAAPHPASRDCIESRRNDLEIAILMQELMGLKEEKAELRGQVHFMGKERKRLEAVLERMALKETGYKTQLQFLTPPTAADNENNNTTPTHAPVQYQEQPSPRTQPQPPTNLTQLLSTINQLNNSISSMESEHQSQLNELTTSNHHLSENLNCTKIKYEKRLKKMEEQIVLTMERHVLQIREYKNKLRKIQQQQQQQ